jgi:hypothetical protein
MPLYMDVGLHSKYLIFLADFQKKRIFLGVYSAIPNTKFKENPFGRSRVVLCVILNKNQPDAH